MQRQRAPPGTLHVNLPCIKTEVKCKYCGDKAAIPLLKTDIDTFPHIDAVLTTFLCSKFKQVNIRKDFNIMPDEEFEALSHSQREMEIERKIAPECSTCYLNQFEVLRPRDPKVQAAIEQVLATTRRSCKYLKEARKTALKAGYMRGIVSDIEVRRRSVWNFNFSSVRALAEAALASLKTYIKMPIKLMIIWGTDRHSRRPMNMEIYPDLLPHKDLDECLESLMEEAHSMVNEA